MNNPIDKVINPIIPEQKLCSKCKQCLLAWSQTQGEICQNEKCENYNEEFISKAFPIPMPLYVDLINKSK